MPNTTTILRYSSLTKDNKQAICNGCGGKGGWINPPEFLFHASCNQHDFYYWRGGNKHDRGTADKLFYKFMREDCNTQAWYKIPLAHAVALTYFVAVRIAGKKYFNYGEMKTKVDLINLSEKQS